MWDNLSIKKNKVIITVKLMTIYGTHRLSKMLFIYVIIVLVLYHYGIYYIYYYIYIILYTIYILYIVLYNIYNIVLYYI